MTANGVLTSKSAAHALEEHREGCQIVNMFMCCAANAARK